MIIIIEIVFIIETLFLLLDYIANCICNNQSQAVIKENNPSDGFNKFCWPFFEWPFYLT